MSGSVGSVGLNDAFQNLQMQNQDLAFQQQAFSQQVNSPALGDAGLNDASQNVQTQTQNLVLQQQAMSQQADPSVTAATQFKKLDDFNNLVSGPNKQQYAHTTTGGGATQTGGVDTYKKTDGTASYELTKNKDGTSTLVSKVNTTVNGQAAVETTTTNFGKDAAALSSSSSFAPGVVSPTNSAGN